MQPEHSIMAHESLQAARRYSKASRARHRWPLVRPPWMAARRSASASACAAAKYAL